MTEKYMELYIKLAKDLNVSKEAYVRYLLKRLRALVLESRDDTAIRINNLIEFDKNEARAEIYDYADKNDCATGKEPQYHCNLVFLYVIHFWDFLESDSDQDFLLCWDTYSLSVEGVEGDFETDCKEIYNFFQTTTDINSTFEGFMNKL